MAKKAQKKAAPKKIAAKRGPYEKPLRIKGNWEDIISLSVQDKKK